MWNELKIVLWIMLPLSGVLVVASWLACRWIEKAMYGDGSPLRERELRD